MILTPSLPDAEAAEDAVEKIVGVDGAGDLAEFQECGAELGGDEFFAAAAGRQFCGASERFAGQSQTLLATRGSGGNGLAAGRFVRTKLLKNRSAQFFQPLASKRRCFDRASSL